MFAIVQVGSFQYRVAEGETIETQRLEGETGSQIALDQVLLWSDGKETKVGQPYLKNVKVKAEVQDLTFGEKLLSFKYRRRKRTSWKKGHRQKLTRLLITKIEA